MKHSELKVKRWKAGSVAAAFALATIMFSSSRSLAQPAGPAPATIHGHVQNAVGQPVTNGEVRLTTDKSSAPAARKYPFVFKLDASGNYTGTVTTPGDYAALVFQGENSVDYITSVKIVAGDNKLLDFDMTRQEYMDRMSPEEKKALEEYKKKNIEVAAANAKIQNLNAQLTQARADTKAGNFAPAIASMTEATTTKPDEPILWVTLGDAQLGAADAAAKEAKTAGKPASDPDVVQKYTDATNSYKKAVDLSVNSKKPNPETIASAYNQLGNAYGKMGDAKNSADAYDGAAKAMPANAGMYYYNEAATLYNAGKMDDSAAAADKAIESDNQRADAYYIKGQALITKASVDPKTNKITAPPGCVDAYQTYLALAPDGPHAAEVKAVLQGIGEEIKSSYKAPAPAKGSAPKKK